VDDVPGDGDGDGFVHWVENPEPAGDVRPSPQLVHAPECVEPTCVLYVLAGQSMHEPSLWLLADWYFPFEQRAQRVAVSCRW